MRLFRNPVFALGVLIVLAFTSTQSAFYLSLSLTLQNGLHHTPLQAGLVFAPLAVAFLAVSLLACRIAGRYRHGIVIGGTASLARACPAIGFTSCTGRPARAPPRSFPDLVPCGSR